MSKNTVVRNPGPDVLVVSSDGRRLAPGAELPLNDSDPVTLRHLTAGRLLRIETPEPAPRRASTKPPKSGEKE